jgi:hypothetical protein
MSAWIQYEMVKEAHRQLQRRDSQRRYQQPDADEGRGGGWLRLPAWGRRVYTIGALGLLRIAGRRRS